MNMHANLEHMDSSTRTRYIPEPVRGLLPSTPTMWSPSSTMATSLPSTEAAEASSASTRVRLLSSVKAAGKLAEHPSAPSALSVFLASKQGACEA
jgi:hypothetical protein